MKAKNKLTFGNQLEFKKWAKAQGLNPDIYYFDNISTVDAEDPCWCPDIPNVYANGKLTWEKALQKINDYFKKKHEIRKDYKHGM